MRFKKHSELEGRHSILSASNYSWIRYDEDKMLMVVAKMVAAARGTRLHKIAADCIKEGLRLQEDGSTLSLYVNDAIGFRMTPENPLYYTDRAFVTPDAICFRNNVLRVHDLKTGEGKSSFDQLLVYCAYFCIEYDYNPFNIEMVCRIYQHNQYYELIPDPDDIIHIMEKMKFFDRALDEMSREELA